ncbi:cholinesterase 1-like [Patiria miniata]|uniref:Carboxylesterase type B domain-containing protein n=1 Tax=Patiria miniata TaxID=46514 RepID=A0A913ZJ94_PATMI|nr:cholinesterase 1-like [Patiria miniata]
MLRSAIALAVLVGLVSPVTSQETVQVTFTAGRVEGYKLDVLGKKVDAFLGIPYAEAPVGARRFKAPTAKATWSAVMDAKVFGSSCAQLGMAMPPDPPALDGQEDCLFLNVWAPSPSQAGTPVLVWIHGGGYSRGTASTDDTNGKIFAAEAGVIVVSMNYRLGAMGFLALGPETAPGNVGLMDQALALQWVQDNIAAVGGDPDQVTIFGQSNGASDVGIHMMAPTSRELFKQAALQGGSALASWDYGTMEGGIGFANALAKKLACDVNNDGEMLTPEEVLTCISLVEIRTILDNQEIPAGAFNTPWKPVIDGTYITEDPMVSIRTGNIKKCSVLIGSNRNEAAFFVNRADGFNDTGMTPANFVSSIKFLFPDANPFGVDAIEFEYTPWEEPANGAGAGLRDATVLTMTDVIFKCPGTTFALGCAAVDQAVYFYQFGQRPSISFWAPWMGVVHGDENNYIFGRPLDPTVVGYTDEEKEFSRMMLNHWANFAKTGDPNKAAVDDPDGPWPVYTTDQKQYLLLDARIVNDTYDVMIGPDSQHCAFWKSYYPTLQRKTGELDELETDWKNQFAEWSNDITDWKDEFKKYKDGTQCD